MTTIPEVVAPTAPISPTTGSVALSTSLVSSDLVVLVSTIALAAGGTRPTPTIGGVDMTISADWTLPSTSRLVIYTMTGLTGSVSIAYNTGGFNAALTAFVIRDLPSPSTIQTAISDWSSALTSAGVHEGPAALSASTGQVAIFVALAAGGTMTVPSTSTPASGWTLDRAGTPTGGGHHAAAHHIVTASGNVQATVSNSNARLMGTAMILFGTGSVVPPLASTFTGWGAPIF